LLLDIMPDTPEPGMVRQAVELLEAGEVIAYPTDTVYGLGCDIMNRKAIDRLYAIKGMDKKHELAFICPDLADIAKYAVVEKQQYRVLRHYLPGPYCFILTATKEVPKLLQSRRKTVGIRIPGHEVIRAIARELGRPIISTTAQRAGEDPHVDPHEIDEAFKGLAMVLDAGGGGMVPTTVVDLTTTPAEIIREGAGSTADFA
jgi:tRNA threonylcarbamoyl adenosine modification protein (Sua5/YciO/YrdC/YwlC family)